MFSPLEQFKVTLLFKFQMLDFGDAVWSNVDWVAVLLTVSVFYFIILPLRYSFVIPWPLVYIHEEVFKFIVGLFKTTNSWSLRFMPWIFVLFYFVLFSNLIGLSPYGYTITSQLFVTFFCSISSFIGITIIGMWLNKFDLVKFFIPSSVSNIYLRSFLVIIEVLSYIIRPFSLGIRLFANMLAGHTLIYILANFSYSVALKFFFLTLVVPFLIIFLIMILEFCIAFIQAYVFVVLTVIYIKDMMEIAH